MAKLRSEDQDLETSFEINFKGVSNDTWLDYEIAFNFGEERKVFSTEASTIDALPKIESIDTIDDKQAGELAGKFVFSIAPQNRAELMVDLMENFLEGSQKELIFEPADPSFELIIRRSHGDGFQVYLWVDCGNTKQLRYTWDARGIRLFTTKNSLSNFVKELKQELAALLVA